MAKQPHLLVESDDVTDTALIPGDPGRVDRIASQCDDVETVAENREYKLVNATYDGVPLTICSTGIGCPSAAIAVEELAAVGVDTLIRVGTTGALQSGIEIGDMVVATGAAKAEGTSKRYEDATVPAVPNYDVLSALVDGAEANGEDVHVGPIVSDDAYYAETDAYVDAWEAAGLLAVEMEAAAVFPAKGALGGGDLHGRRQPRGGYTEGCRLRHRTPRKGEEQRRTRHLDHAGRGRAPGVSGPRCCR